MKLKKKKPLLEPMEEKPENSIISDANSKA